MPNPNPALVIYILVVILPSCYVIWRSETDKEYWKRYERD